jgi:ABC-type transport system substrate-binding protein
MSVSGINLSRRGLLAAGAALPFLPRVARAARTPGVLTFGLSSYPPNLNPFTHTGTAALTVKLLIYRGLLSYDAKGEVRPELAESFEQTSPTVWKFSLKQAVFHNGKPVTAEDVKWSFEQVVVDRNAAFMRGQMQVVEKIDTPDPRTVVITLKEPVATFPLWLAGGFLNVLAKGSTDGGGTPVSAGPFKVKNLERGVSVELEAFDKFHRPGLPKLKGLKIIAYADENARVAALQAGDVDLIEYVPWQAMTTIEADPKLKMDNVDGPFMGLSFNGRGPFKDARVRRAVAHAVRREDIVASAFFGRGSKLEGIPLAPNSPFFDAGRAKGWAYDKDRAKALLKEAGVENGFSCTLLSTAQYGMHKSTAEVVQQHLGEIGINVTLNLPDWATRVNLGTRGQFDFAVMGTTADNNDPDGMASLLDGTLGPSVSRSAFLDTPKLHDLFAKGRSESDFAKRKEIYAELEKEALEIASLVGLAWRSQGYAMTKDVMGFTNMPAALTFNSGQTLEETYFA